MLNSLPDSVPDLKEMVVEFHGKMEDLGQENISLHQEVDGFKQEVQFLREELRLLRQQIFGRKSEKYGLETENGAVLFPEWEDDEKPPVNEEPKKSIEVEGHVRKKSGRKAIPDHLPRVIVEHDLPENEKVCNCGCMMSRISDETSEQLDMSPVRYQVIHHVRFKYACKSCEGLESEGGTVKIAPLPEQIIPKSIATPRLLAHIITAKFCDALPFYRQEGQFFRSGIEISRATMCNWAVQVYNRCKPLLELLKLEILSGFLINADETHLQVLNEPGREAQSKSYMWVFRGGLPDKPVLYFQYHPSRSGKVAEEFLSRYQGCVQTDGYAGYNFLDSKPGITHAACWAHVRRKFMDTIKAAGGSHGHGKADEALVTIRKLYQIEKEVKDLKPEEIALQRLEKSQPILIEFEKWLQDNAQKTPPKSLLGKAFAYTLGQWTRLTRYLQDGRVRMDNNLAENSIRPFVVGRKNWLFNGTPEGARASAFFYSIIETAKSNNLDPYKYLCHLFENLPLAKTEDALKALMPQSCGLEKQYRRSELEK